MSEVQCILILRVHGVPKHLPTLCLNILSQEAARMAVLALQSILLGSEGVKVTPSPVRNVVQDSKQGKPRVD